MIKENFYIERTNEMSKITCKTLNVMAMLAILVIVSVACNSTSNARPAQPTNALPSNTPVPPSATPVPATATLEPSPTPTRVPQVGDYLLSPSDLSFEIYKNRAYQYIGQDGAVTYGVLLFNAGVARITNEITVAAQPYAELPDLSRGMDRVQDPDLDPNSAAYTSNQNTVYLFFKGNGLVSIESDLALADLVDLGKIIESRLPDSIPLSAIAFPELVDEAASSRYFKSIALAKEVSGGAELVPTTVFSAGDSWCLAMESGIESQPFSLAIYDPEANEYVYRIDPSFSFRCDIFYEVIQPGSYEVRVAVNDTIVAILPFEIQ